MRLLKIFTRYVDKTPNAELMSELLDDAFNQAILDGESIGFGSVKQYPIIFDDYVIIVNVGRKYVED